MTCRRSERLRSASNQAGSNLAVQPSLLALRLPRSLPSGVAAGAEALTELDSVVSHWKSTSARKNSSSERRLYGSREGLEQFLVRKSLSWAVLASGIGRVIVALELFFVSVAVTEEEVPGSYLSSARMNPSSSKFRKD